MKQSLTFLITAGPTREYIDPVRYISNASSGKMGYAVAACARRKKHRVILVSGPVEIAPPEGVTLRRVISADDMFREVKKNLPAADVFISVAAVADYRPARRKIHKMKKNARGFSLRLEPTTDILAYAGRRKGNLVLVGFALESKDLLRAAKKKLEVKNLDLIVANGHTAIGEDVSRCWLIGRDGTTRKLARMNKIQVAERIIDEALRIRQGR